jgi:hypothetical protein
VRCKDIKGRSGEGPILKRQIQSDATPVADFDSRTVGQERLDKLGTVASPVGQFSIRLIHMPQRLVLWFESSRLLVLLLGKQVSNARIDDRIKFCPGAIAHFCIAVTEYVLEPVVNIVLSICALVESAGVRDLLSAAASWFRYAIFNCVSIGDPEPQAWKLSAVSERQGIGSPLAVVESDYETHLSSCHIDHQLVNGLQLSVVELTNLIRLNCKEDFNDDNQAARNLTIG